MSDNTNYATVENMDEDFFEQWSYYQFLQDNDIKKKNGKLFKADYTGMGWMLVKYGVIEKMKYPYFPLNYANISDCNDGKGGKVVVAGKSGNAPLRTQAGVFCNVRPYGPITVVRCMPCLPYSQDKSKFNVNEKTGIVHTEMNTPGIQMAYACRLFLKMINDTGILG